MSFRNFSLRSGIGSSFTKCSVAPLSASVALSLLLGGKVGHSDKAIRIRPSLDPLGKAGPSFPLVGELLELERSVAV